MQYWNVNTQSWVNTGAFTWGSGSGGAIYVGHGHILNDYTITFAGLAQPQTLTFRNTEGAFLTPPAMAHEFH